MERKITPAAEVRNSINFPSQKEVSEYYDVEVNDVEYRGYKESIQKKQKMILEQLNYLNVYVETLTKNSEKFIQNAARTIHNPSPRMAENLREDIESLQKKMLKAQQEVMVMTRQKEMFSVDNDAVLIEKQIGGLFDEISVIKSALLKIMLLGYVQSSLPTDSQTPVGGIWQLSDEGSDIAARYARDGMDPQNVIESMQKTLGKIPADLHAKSYILSSGMAAVTAALQQAKYAVERDGGTLFMPDNKDAYYESHNQVLNIVPVDKCVEFDFANVAKMNESKSPIIYLEKNTSSISMRANDLAAIMQEVPNAKMVIVDYSLAVPGTDYSDFFEAIPVGCTVIMVTSLQKLYQCGDDTEQGSLLTIMNKKDAKSYKDGIIEMGVDFKTYGVLPKPSQVAYWSLIKPETAAQYGALIAKNTKIVGKYIESLQHKEFGDVISEVTWGQEPDGSTSSPVVMIRFDFVRYFNDATGDAKKDISKNLEHTRKFEKKWYESLKGSESKLNIVPSGDSFGFRYSRTTPMTCLPTNETSLRIAPGINNPIEIKMILESFRLSLKKFCKKEPKKIK